MMVLCLGENILTFVMARRGWLAGFARPELLLQENRDPPIPAAMKIIAAFLPLRSCKQAPFLLLTDDHHINHLRLRFV